MPVASIAWATQRGPGDRTALVLAGDMPQEMANSYENFSFNTSEWVLVDLAAGTVVRRAGPGFPLSAMGTSPDGDRVALGGDHGEVALMDVHTGETIAVATDAHPQTAWVTWASDGATFASTGWDGSVRLWDGRTGDPLGGLTSPERVVANAAFVDDGDTVVIVTYTDGFYLWDTTPDRAVEFACRAAGRDLTESERIRWVGDLALPTACPPRAQRPTAFTADR